MRLKKTWASLDDEERARLEFLICDALGISAAGHCAPGISSMLQAVSDLGGGDITPLWTNIRTNAPVAGLALSLLIHAWDFDDTHDEAIVHTSSIAVPAAMAVAQLDEDVSGEQLLDGVVAGVQALATLSRWTGPMPGVIRTAGLGSIAAAIAAGAALRLSESELMSAAGLSLVSALSPTTRQAVVDGSLAKRLQPGLAVQTGITAALLARRGVVGPKDWLTGTYGVIPEGKVAGDELFRGPFEVSRIALKPYPACRYTHAALTAAHEAFADVNETDQVLKVIVRVPEGDAYRLVSRPFEDRGSPIIDAQFSIPWQVAALAVTGKYDLSTLSGEDLSSSRISDFARCVEVRQDLSASDVMSGAEVELEFTDGRTLSVHASMPGSKDDPLDWEQLSTKIDACYAVAGRSGGSAKLLEFVRRLPAAGVSQLPTLISQLMSTATFEEKE